MDRDLIDHGAVSAGSSINGVARDVGDVDLSDHGYASSGSSISGVARDVGDVDLSDHGVVSYAPMTETWGTNDIDIAKQMDILMHASMCTTIDQIIPLLNAESLAKVVEYRYRKTAGTLDDHKHGLDRDTKVDLGMDMNMDLAIISSAIMLNPKALEQIFNANLYMGDENLTNIFGVLDAYQKSLDVVDDAIPLINGGTGEPRLDGNGNAINAQDVIAYLKSKKELMQINPEMNVAQESLEQESGPKL